MRPGQRLPSTRSLAHDLSISRVPVVTAFEQLAAEGYLEGKVGAGSYVSSALPQYAVRLSTTARPPAGRRRIPRERLATTPEPWLDAWGGFRVGQPALKNQFPAETWARLIARRARMQPRQQMTYGDAMGFMPLREALAEHLRTVRSVRCTADQIMIVSGSQQALALASRATVAPGDAAWMEEPGFAGARDALSGARRCADRAGAVERRWARRAPAGASALPVAARCLRDAVASISARRDDERRAAHAPARVGDAAAARGVEDDYDSEYPVRHQPIASLHGMDRADRVIYIGTFSKVLFPAVRIGYVVMPDNLIARFRRLRQALDNFPPPLYQAALFDFMRDGQFARHLRRTRAAYAERRRTLVRALDRELGDVVQVVGDHAGMHLVATLDADDREIAMRAAAAGLSVIRCHRATRAVRGVAGCCSATARCESARSRSAFASSLG